MAPRIHPTAEVSQEAFIGEGGRVWHWAQIREGARVGDNCIIGKDVYIDSDVVIGNDCKVENFATIYKGVTVGNRVFVGPHVCFTNDLYPRAVSPDWRPVQTRAQAGASLGANATILGEAELAAVREVLASGMLTQGPKVEAFEKAFAKDLGRKHAIAVTNGTAALHVALLAHGIGPGQEVVIPPLTFFATASTVLLCGAKPVFVDIDRSSYNVDPAKVSSVITRKTAAIMPVHLYGQTAEMDPILAAARDRGIPVIEDAAQAAGAEYHGKKAGNLGDTACFSFYATKNMTTGEGGMIVTDDDRIAEKARLLRHHGQPAKYEHVLVGFNYRMTEIAAAIGLAQLAKLDGWVKQRRANARALTKGLDGIEGLVPPSEGNWMVHSFYQYIVRREEPFPRSRDEIVEDLNEDGIGCRPSYPMPLYKQKALRDLKIRGRCPVAEDVIPGLFELPAHPGVGPAEIERIVAAVEEVARTD